MSDTAALARGLAVRAAYGGGTLAVAGLLGVGLLRAQVAIAKHVIGDTPGFSHDDEGSYGAGIGDPHRILVLGDSTAAGVGAGSSQHTIGATIATGVAALSGRPVELRNVSRSGATSPQLIAQTDRGLAAMPEPEVVVIMIGANDVKERIDQDYAVRCLSETVHRLRAAGAEVVVGTCPDMGTIRPIPQPLRSLVQRWSRDLAAAQTVGVVQAGGRSVSLGDLLGQEFWEQPAEMFSEDRFHPSAAGYARAAAVLLPSVCDALGMLTPDTGRAPDHHRGERVEPLVTAAARAAREPGSEVTPVEAEGHGRHERSRWAQLLRRHGADVAGSRDGTPPDPPAPGAADGATAAGDEADAPG
ncbi:SGNH/GDSL hydrolase family protein [Ornithinicoccus hortensis]|uniref:Lysophospholipase L1-like esterase n=1 Tax=Ornithinicoccus hortensis TaxID=82346 RepID=A0A542YVH1_9MICO|nr:SGNH/GDSL hydrolase family protein [Ornithinicoccus hortensis]TQL52070.1 lysophospholipase L1-like esterase [Ornithinicoccus hortensis]